MTNRILYVGAEELEIGVNERRHVGILLHGLEKQAGMVPGLLVALDLSPQEARNLADSLRRKADEAEAGLPRA